MATYVNIHKHIANTFLHTYIKYNISHISHITYQYQNILTFFYPLAIQLPWPGWPGIDPSSDCRRFGSGEGVERGSAGCERLSFDRTVLKISEEISERWFPNENGFQMAVWKVTHGVD